MSQVSVKIVSERYNKLVPRREVVVEVNHVGGGTPSRQQVVSAVREALGLPSHSIVVVRRIVTIYGACLTRAYVHVYESLERAKAFEPKYILKRNGLIREEAPKQQE